MPAIADQVAALESDHADALAKLDVLNAANAALIEAINTITAEKAALAAHNDSLMAMVESVGNSALEMLKAARLPAGTPAEVIPFAPKPKTVTTASVAPSVGLADVLITEEMLRPEPAWQAVAQAMASDTVPRAVPSWPPKPATAPIIEPASAVDLVKRRLLPALSLMRRPVDLTTRAKDDPAGLPMFLRRDTVFRAAAYG
jgi:hypothetical protein